MSDYQNLIDQNRILSQEIKRRTDHLAAINIVAAIVSQSLDLGVTLQTALETVIAITGAEAGGISLIDEVTGDVVLRAQQGWIHDFVNQNPMRVPSGAGMSGRLIRTDDVIIENDLNGSQEIAVPRFYDEAFRSMVMAPMHARSKIIGILSIMSFQPNRFNADVIDVLRVIADTVGVALDNANLYETSLENQKRLSAILQSTADGIIATDCAGRIKLVNQAAAALLNLKAEALINKPVRSLELPDSIRDPLLFALSSRGESSRSFLASLENGRYVSVLISEILVGSQLEIRGDEGWVIVFQDVTHLHEAEMARTRFIQAAAHDMRNPLGVALNSLDMLDRRLGDQPDKSINEIVGIATDSVQRLQGLIDDLFNLEHIQSGYGFTLEDVDVGELIYEVSGAVKPAIETRGLDYEVDLEGGIAPLHIDRRWVSRAISNYLDNAIGGGLQNRAEALLIFETGFVEVGVIEGDADGIGDHAQHVDHVIVEAIRLKAHDAEDADDFAARVHGSHDP
jgi:PAS domain S-box-containing protein